MIPVKKQLYLKFDVRIYDFMHRLLSIAFEAVWIGLRKATVNLENVGEWE